MALWLSTSCNWWMNTLRTKCLLTIVIDIHTTHTCHPHLPPSPATITWHPHPTPSPATLTCHPHLPPSPDTLTCHPHLPPSPDTLTCHPHLPPLPATLNRPPPQPPSSTATLTSPFLIYVTQIFCVLVLLNCCNITLLNVLWAISHGLLEISHCWTDNSN